ncbi:LLM class flavin-dependent oxidoreductase [Dactylosporangium sp. CA-233914]|uniref:LLM class flavin-dependent oxidoreductase n=1 Tax=Dactylosporangium sp. CA-233914 TaxID=3239934 RepID=UPI003D8D5322
MKVGLHFSCTAVDQSSWPDLYDAALTQAEIADELGYDSAVVSEHHFKAEGWIPSPFVLCGAIAARTRNLRIGTDIVILPFQHPIKIAEDVLTLDNLSRGRAVLGAGMGHSAAEFEALQIPYRQRVSRSEEALEVIRKVFTTPTVSHQGKYFQFSGITVTPRPVQQPAPPIWYGAISPAGARRAARFADALVIGPSLSFAEMLDVREAYHDELRSLGRDPEDGEIIVRREAYVAADSRDAWTDGLAALKYQASRIYADFPADGTDADFREFSATRYLVGSPDEVYEQCLPIRDKLGAGNLLLRIQLPGLDDDLALAATRLFGEQVLPRL